MQSGVNFYHISEIGERNVVIKKEQTNPAQLPLVSKVTINIILHAFLEFVYKTH